MIGDNILAAPLTDSASMRKVYLPKGNWYDYNNNKIYAGEQSYEISTGLDQIPIFVKEGSILPIAKPVEFVTSKPTFNITCFVFGKNVVSAHLFEDDGTTFGYETTASYNTVLLSCENNKGKITGKGK